MSLTGKVAIITGAAGGIGSEAARHLAKLGAKVSIVDLNQEQLTVVADEISKTGASKPLSIVADITKDAERIISETVGHFGQLDILVNNVGIFGADSVVDFDVSFFDRIMNVNIRSMIVLTNLAVPHLEKTKGNIVNISSICGLAAYGEFMSYCISKAAVCQFTKCSAIGLAAKGIRMNAIAPGITRTPIFSALGQTVDEVFQAYQHDFLIKRPADPTEIAAGIAYLATQPFVNGIVLAVDGGFSCAK